MPREQAEELRCIQTAKCCIALGITRQIYLHAFITQTIARIQ